MEALPRSGTRRSLSTRSGKFQRSIARDNGWVTTPQELDEHFRAAVGALHPSTPERDPDATAAVPDPSAPVRAGTRLTGEQALRVFEAQLASRHLDLAARWLRSFGEGFYTIGSSGHEGN